MKVLLSSYLRILQGGNYISFTAMALVPMEKLSVVETHNVRLKVRVYIRVDRGCCNKQKVSIATNITAEVPESSQGYCTKALIIQVFKDSCIYKARLIHCEKIS